MRQSTMRTAWILLGGLLLFGGSLEAQRRPTDQLRGGGDHDGAHREGPRGFVSIQLLGADPVGPFGQVVDQGFGAALAGLLPVSEASALSLRGELGFIVYGHERQRVCFSRLIGCRVTLDLTTSNSIFFGGIGPELAVPRGDVRPYLNATAGFSYFATTSSVSGSHDHDDFASTRNFDDLVFSTRIGGGVRIRLRGGPSPILLDLGLQYHDNGVAEYLREGDIVDHPDGSISIFPNRSEANLVGYRIGVTFGVGGGGDDRHHERRQR